MTKHIVSVSSGLGSAFAWKLVCDRYGPENVTGVFTDVNGEHPDNYRFLAEIQYRLGSRLVKIGNDGKTIWDIMIEHRFLANSQVDLCSRILKRESFRDWLSTHADPADTTVYLGIDWSEIHRMDRARPHWERGGWTISAPLCEPPYPDKFRAQAWLDAEGIKRPALYDLGFGHANCGGGCVKAGIGQFRKLLAVDRKWYVNWWEAGEERVRAHLGKNVSILRVRAKGSATKPLTLRKLREGIDAAPDLFADEPEEAGCGVCFLEGPEPLHGAAA
jgi:3'-phosphoadenosine 5'-phosphosulfate sulfotransferase (PAPS reductase)/FAD synthetase